MILSVLTNIFLLFAPFAKRMPTIQSGTIQKKSISWFSEHLNRNVSISISSRIGQEASLPLHFVFLQDGQDYEVLDMDVTLANFYTEFPSANLVLVAIPTSDNRMQEYGVIDVPDYKNRGSLAGEYALFWEKELWQRIKNEYSGADQAKMTICGFSLSGLSAFDLAWSLPYFHQVGVFSGSFWWRSKAYEDDYDDENGRIMHVKVRDTAHPRPIRAWFQCGTEDEKDDRNNNGIIDSIEDTLDLIAELRKKNITDVHYEEVVGGEHHPLTWKKIMPHFLIWAHNSQ